MRALTLALLLSGCAAVHVELSAEPSRTHRATALEQAIAATVSMAARELIENDDCSTLTFLESCERGSILTETDFHAGNAEYFDSFGAQVGSETWGDLGPSFRREGKRFECPTRTPNESLCDRARATLRRIGATISVALPAPAQATSGCNDGDAVVQKLEVGVGVTRFELATFKASVAVSEDGSRPVELQLDAADVHARRVPTLSDFAVAKFDGVPLPQTESIESGASFAIPAEVRVGDGESLVVRVRSRYVVAK